VLWIRTVATLSFALWFSSSTCVPQGAREPTRARPPAASSLEQVDINHASLEQLIQVPGLTRPWAERIVRFRPYRSKLDLEQDGVLPGEVYNRIKDSIIAHHDKK
jgi:competence protein ComEA